MTTARRLRRMALINRKGGVGKSRTAVNLAAAMALRGLHVLVIDLDSQANATKPLSIEDHSGTPKLSAYDAFYNPANTAQAIGPTCIDGVDMIYGSLEMESIELQLLLENDTEITVKLRQMLDAVEALGKYDVAIIDCPGAFNIATRNAMTSVDLILTPVQLNYEAAEGRGRLIIELLKMIEKGRLKNPPLVYAFANQFDARTVRSHVLAEQLRDNVTGGLPVDGKLHVEVLRERPHDQTSEVLVVHNATVIADAYGLRGTVFQHAPRSRSAKQYKAIATAVLEALEQKTLLHAN